MNIFVLHPDPKICAQMHCDSHCVKMILELAQLLSTTHRVLDGKEVIVPQNGRNYKRWILDDDREHILYKSTHINHPCAIWLRKSVGNYMWTYKLLKELCAEYYYRYGIEKNKQHKVVWSGVLDALDSLPFNLPIGGMTNFALAMPEDYKCDNPFESYRLYYLCDKRDLLSYTKREVPKWVQEEICEF